MTLRGVQILGLDGVKKKLKRKEKQYARGFEVGMLKAGLFVQRESQLIVPVLTGNLKGSAGTAKKGTGFKVEVTIFYTAAYALWVHELTHLRHKPGKQAKFLSSVLVTKKDQIFRIIYTTAKAHR